MTSEQHRLESLGWRALDEGRDEHGRYCVLTKSCGHFAISFAPTHSEAWSALFFLVLRLTEEGHCMTPGFRR